MASYPTELIQNEGTALIPQSGHELYRTKSGKPIVRRHYTSTREDLVVEHYLDQAQKDVLDAFYTANKQIAFSFTYAADGTTRTTCYFVKAPVCTPASGGYYNVTVNAVVA